MPEGTENHDAGKVTVSAAFLEQMMRQQQPAAPATPTATSPHHQSHPDEGAVENMLRSNPMLLLLVALAGGGGVGALGGYNYGATVDSTRITALESRLDKFETSQKDLIDTQSRKIDEMTLAVNAMTVKLVESTSAAWTAKDQRTYDTTIRSILSDHDSRLDALEKMRR